MNRRLVASIALFLLSLSNSRAQEDAKFVADNLKFSREFYAKAHFVAVVTLPGPFKYDRYPSNGPERIQTGDGTYFRQHGQPWKHVDQPMRSGLPINYAENDRYVMTFAGQNEWGHFGEPVEKETAAKLEGWIKLIDAAIHSEPGAAVKLVDKSEVDGRAHWIFESPNPGGQPTRLTFRKPANDKTEKVLLHEFSGSLRLESGPDGQKVVSGGAADLVRFGFGYMMKLEGGDQELSERAWEEMKGSR